MQMSSFDFSGIRMRPARFGCGSTMCESVNEVLPFAANLGDGSNLFVTFRPPDHRSDVLRYGSPIWV